MVDAIATLLERLVRIDTQNPGGDERSLAQLLRDELAARKPDELRLVEVPRDGAVGAYVLARWGTPRLLVNAHIDTVPVNPGWSFDPFTPRIVDGRLYGLGSCDIKGAIASILCALDAAPARDLLVVFSGDEEHAGTVMRSLLANERALGSVESAIVCEPTSCRVGTRHRGILAIEAHVSGRGGHSSRADDLPAPVADLARLAVAWSDWGNAQRDRGPTEFRGMCANVAKLQGGVAFNVVPDEARLSFSVRPPPGADVSKVRDELLAIAKTTLPRATVEIVIEHPSFATRNIATFSPALGTASPVDLGFWTEAAILVESGIDAVVFGPGDIAQAHAPDEFVPLSDLARSRDVFVKVFKERGTR